MYAGGQNDCAAHSYEFWAWLEISNNHHLTVVACKRLGEHCLANFVFCLVGAKFVKQGATVAISVRIAVSNVNLVVVVLKRHFELKGVVVAAPFFLHPILEVGNVFAIAIPPIAALSSSVSTWVEKGFLPLVVTTIRLYQINDCELVPNISLHVRYFEVKPLRVRCSVVIVLQYQVVRVRLAYFYNSSQISTLKSRLENQCQIMFEFFNVIWF